MSNVFFKQLELGPMQNFVYLVGDPATRSLAVVDPAWESTRSSTRRGATTWRSRTCSSPTSIPIISAAG